MPSAMAHIVAPLIVAIACLYAWIPLTTFRIMKTGSNLVLQYRLLTPITTTLDPIELPQLPSEHAMVWCDGGSATPTLQVTYERDVTIAYNNLLDAIADIATS